jgi:hypothetical protein
VDSVPVVPFRFVPVTVVAPTQTLRPFVERNATAITATPRMRW